MLKKVKAGLKEDYYTRVIPFKVEVNGVTYVESPLWLEFMNKIKWTPSKCETLRGKTHIK